MSRIKDPLTLAVLFSWVGFVEYMSWSGWFSVPVFVLVLLMAFMVFIRMAFEVEA